ncbi:MAG: response regulator [Planctomycetota bacterium]|jgi:CheY-like chemotaxis protein
MSDTTRKTLLIIQTPGDVGAISIEKLSEALESGIDIQVVAPENARAALQADAIAAVLAETGNFLPMAQEVANLQTNSLLNALGEGLCIADADGTLLWSNQRFTDCSEHIRTNVARCCKETIKSFRTILKRNGTLSQRVRKHQIAENDGDRVLEVVISPIIENHDESNTSHLQKVVAVLWDITSTSKMQRKLNALDQAGAELVRLEIDHVRTLNAAERLHILEEKIITYAHEILEFDHITVHLLDEETQRLELIMTKGLPDEVGEIDLYAQAEGSGTTGFVAATGKSYICYDTSKDDRYIEGLEQAGSSLSVPLRMGDKVIGVFNAESDAVGAFTEDDRQFAEIFARYIGLALHILDLLVAEKYTTGETVSDTVAGEISEPLDDLLHEAEWLKTLGATSEEAAEHAERILADVASIRSRMKSAVQGPRSVLGAEQALKESKTDPLIEGRRILIADDEPMIRNTIRDVLQRRGAICFTCTSGVEAIELLEQIQRGEKDAYPFDLIVSDIKMPDRNGYEVYSAAKRCDVHTPVILMTGFGYDPHHSIVRASQEGLQCVLFKPFQARQLLKEVRRTFQEKGA